MYMYSCSLICIVVQDNITYITKIWDKHIEYNKHELKDTFTSKNTSSDIAKKCVLVINKAIYRMTFDILDTTKVLGEN